MLSCLKFLEGRQFRRNSGVTLDREEQKTLGLFDSIAGLCRGGQRLCATGAAACLLRGKPGMPTLCLFFEEVDGAQVQRRALAICQDLQSLLCRAPDMLEVHMLVQGCRTCEAQWGLLTT